jgi:hypothetical protein
MKVSSSKGWLWSSDELYFVDIITLFFLKGKGKDKGSTITRRNLNEESDKMMKVSSSKGWLWSSDELYFVDIVTFSY